MNVLFFGVDNWYPAIIGGSTSYMLTLKIENAEKNNNFINICLDTLFSLDTG